MLTSAATPTGQVPLTIAQRCQLTTRALAPLSFGVEVLITLLYAGPLLIAHSTDGAPVWWILSVAVGIALTDVGGVLLVLHGLVLLGGALWGSAIQTTDRLQIGRTRRAGAARQLLVVRGEQVGALRLAKRLPMAALQEQTTYTLIYSPRARIIWHCAPVTQEVLNADS
jgi:hypothetical protein